MNIWCKVEENEFGYIPYLVFHSTATIVNDVIPYTRQYGHYYIYDLPNLDKKQFSVFRDFLVSLMPSADLVKYKPADNFKFDNVLYGGPVPPLADDMIKNICVYAELKEEAMKDITENNYCTSDDILLFRDIQMFVSLRQVLEQLMIKPNNYYEEVDQVVNVEPHAYGDSLVYVYTHFKKNLDKTKQFFRDNFSIKFVIGKVKEDIEALPDNSYIIKEYGPISSQGNAYVFDGKLLTDFIIKVKYCVNLPDGGKKYIITMLGKNGTADDVEFPITFNKTRFKERIAHY